MTAIVVGLGSGIVFMCGVIVGVVLADWLNEKWDDPA